MEHKRIIQEWYEVSFKTSHRFLEGKIDEFLNGSPEIDDETWQDNHTILRDFEGDFEGVLIYHTDETKSLIKFICGKINIDYKSVENLNFKLVT